MKSAEIRQRFLDFFAARGHAIVERGSLVPAGDSTLLFTNAGMVQFKDVFLGTEQRDCPRAVTSQPCVRAGGKHNDLENVGYTARHHTFFEMLGNFSFGDYFKREAIHYAWEFLTGELGLPPEKLWVTVFHEDDAAAAIWLDEIKVAPDRFSRMGEKDNFWAMGDTGPCGPCSEIFYDHGPGVAGGPPGSADEDGDRYVEIWNLVFMQFNRAADGTMTPLPKPSVDTGAGLERLAAVMQKVSGNYEIDLFQSLIRDIAGIAGTTDLHDNSLWVIADHIRSCTFLVVDGVLPANEGRGYVLRRILRRAVRHGYRLGIGDTFFYKLVGPLTRVMGAAYPELSRNRSLVEKVLKKEEEQFARTLEHGMTMLEKVVAELDGRTIPGDVVFRLYDTYGFPVDLTADVAREQELELDLEGFERAMQRQRGQARAASRFDADSKLDIDPALVTRFTGYDRLQDEGRISALFSLDRQPLEEVVAGAEALLILDSSPFYGESGGQIGDRGVLEGKQGRFEVVDTRKQAEVLIHHGRMISGRLKPGEQVVAQVAAQDRAAITLNHSATHLLHAALRKVLGRHVQQKGSLVAADRLRFDFSHPAPLSNEELKQVEEQVNTEILANSPVVAELLPLAEAKKKGALSLFGEKYGDEVRVVAMGGDYSIEFCGGCHVQRTGDIGLLRISSESGIAAGVRRLEAVTGKGALALMDEQQQTLQRLGSIVKTAPEELVGRIEQLVARNRELEKELAQARLQMASGSGVTLAERAEQVNGVKVLAVSLAGLDAKSLRSTVDRLKDELGSSVVVLASAAGDKVSLVAGVSRNLTSRVEAGELVNMVAQQIGGRGGGRADFAMAGGNDPQAVPAALESVRPWLEDRL